jgi:uncharacterized protein (TIGR02231 family)
MFKKLSILITLTFSALISKADDGQKIASKVQKVTIFLSGAQVTRTAAVNIPAGTSTLVFENLSQQLDPASMQVHADGQFTILSVQHEFNSPADPAKIKQLELLEAAQKEIKDKIIFQKAIETIYQSEETTLMKNQSVKAENASLDVAVLKQALDFQTQRLTAIKEKEFSIASQIAALTAELQKNNQQITAINTERNLRTSNIIVTVSSKAAIQSTFFISYLINGAMWYPGYDINAKNVNRPITIVYNANVSQTSGEEWKNVKITLSTGNPMDSGVKPELNPDYLNLPVNVPMAPSASLRGAGAGAMMEKASHDEKVSETVPVEVRQVENQTNFEFDIENPYTIASDGKVCKVEINQVEVKASYQYYVAPKITTDVFLTAQLTDWNKYNFLSGEANLFFEGTYIGKSNIDVNSTADTLNLSLGTDKSIVVTRVLQKELSVRQSLGSNKKETKDWQIEIKNRKNQPINLLVEDQVPVSQNSAIEVEVQETSGARPDPLTGKISWNFSLKPQDDRKIELKYLVKYPKNEMVVVQ